MHLQAERTVGAHQRAIESGTARLGSPASLYVILAVVSLWILLNALGPRVGLRAPDPPPFAWLSAIVDPPDEKDRAATRKKLFERIFSCLEIEVRQRVALPVG